MIFSKTLLARENILIKSNSKKNISIIVEVPETLKVTDRSNI